MGWLSLGDADAPPTTPLVHPAVSGYKTCRATSPVDMTRAALTPQDPCWTQLVALRRYQGRDPLGRDVYGEAGPQVTLKAQNFAEQERAAPAKPQSPVILVVSTTPQERVLEKVRQVERTKEEIEERRKKRAADKTETKFEPEPWQLVAAALTIGVTLGRFWGGK